MKKTYKQIKLYQKRLKEPLNKTDFKNFNMYLVACYSVLILGIQLIFKALWYRKPIFIGCYLVSGINLILMFFNIKNYKFDKIIYSVLGLLLSLILTIIFIKYPILLPITTVVVSYPLYCFLKLRKMKKLRCLNLFEDNGFRGANLLLKELVPFESFDNLISINIKLKEEIYGKDMEYFNDNLAYYCDQKKILFMGFKYEQYKLSYKVYLYADKYDLENLEKFLKKNINYEFEIKVVKDKKYEYYLNHICPSDKLFMHMCNNNIINNKIPETVNLFEEQSIILVLAFENKENALNCFKELKESGEYEQIDYDDNSKHVKENNLNKLYTNMIYIEQRTRIGLSKLNMITDYMYDIAKKYNGSFEEWGIGELTKEED
jgi:hypothetical protein